MGVTNNDARDEQTTAQAASAPLTTMTTTEQQVDASVTIHTEQIPHVETTHPGNYNANDQGNDRDPNS